MAEYKGIYNSDNNNNKNNNNNTFLLRQYPQSE